MAKKTISGKMEQIREVARVNWMTKVLHKEQW